MRVFDMLVKGPEGAYKKQTWKMANRKAFIRYCIRYKFHQEKRAAKACASMCSILGKNTETKSA